MKKKWWLIAVIIIFIILGLIIVLRGVGNQILLNDIETVTVMPATLRWKYRTQGTIVSNKHEYFFEGRIVAVYKKEGERISKDEAIFRYKDNDDKEKDYVSEIDGFLEELAEDIASSQKENAVLKSKMKVLVDKIEEYRANEEALNLAILSAQKLAVQIESEARQRAAEMIEDAERQVKARVGSIEELTVTEETRLANAQSATRAFLEKARKACTDQLKNLDAVSEELGLPAEETVEEEQVGIDEVDIDEAVRSIEQEVSRAAKPEPALDLDLSDFDLSPAPKKKNLSSTQSFNL